MEIYIANLDIGDSLPINFETEANVPSEYHLNKENVKIEVSGTMYRYQEFFYFEGEAKTLLSYNCDNCLSEVTYLLAFPIIEKFDSKKNNTDDIWEFHGKYICLDEPVLMNLFLNIPIKLVCSEDCEGLCQYCGQNLNQGSCDCTAPMDSRFSGLSALFNDEEV